MTEYFAFDPPEEPLENPVEDMGWPDAAVSMYDPELSNPYAVPDATEKIYDAIRALPDPPHTYTPVDTWVRIEYRPLVERGEVNRVNNPTGDA